MDLQKVKTMKSLDLWGMTIPLENLSSEQISFLESVPKELPCVDWLWLTMDSIWHSFDLDNRVNLDPYKLGKFYAHPIWLVNGIFTKVDRVSSAHRDAIGKYLSDFNLELIADYGGGSGMLAETLSNKLNTEIHIIEPFPIDYFKNRILHLSNITYRNDFSTQTYDAVIAQDVLEHIPNPVEVAYEMALKTKADGVLIFANCFYPSIECHLPQTFYLRHCFQLVMVAMGLRFIGTVPDAMHAQVFRKNKSLSLKRALFIANVLRPFGEIINFTFLTSSKIRNLFR